MGRRHYPKSIIFVALLVCSSTGLGDSWAQPRPRIFASAWGAYGFKVLEPRFLKDSLGELFRLDQDGSVVVVWRARLVNVPHQVFVSEDGQRVVTIDTYGRLGDKHAVVVYDANGKVLLDCGIDEVLTPIEAALFVDRSVSSFHWAKHCEFRFTGKSGHFQITFKWPDDAESLVSEYRKIIPEIKQAEARKKLEQWMAEYDSLAKATNGNGREILIDLTTGKFVDSAVKAKE